MFGWLNRLRSAPPAAVPAPAAPRRVDAGAGPAAADGGDSAPPPPSLLAWLLDAAAPHHGAPTAAERAALAPLDALLARPAWPADLLPRAPAVIPQLLGLLRQEMPSRAAIVQQIGKDVVLAAEVLRMARSPYYRSRAEIDTLDAAVTLLGTSGLQSAIARVVLKPVFDTQAGGLAGRSARRAWELAEREAEACADLAAQAGIERFEGFLAGLLHGTGRTALLRTLDRAGIEPASPWSLAFDHALEDRADRMFGRLALGWQITPALSELAAAVAQRGLEDAGLPLAAALRQAQRQAAAVLAARGGGAARGESPAPVVA
jgi:hypothetical protein